jgi:hypothetical protein
MNLPSLIVLPHVQAWYLPQTYSLCLVLLAIAVGVRQLANATKSEPVAAPARAVETPDSVHALSLHPSIDSGS